MTIYAYALIGLIVGILARVALPSTRLVGFWGSALLGAAGGVIGALIASLFIPDEVTTRIQPVSVVLAILFSALVSVALIIITRTKRFA